MSNFFSSKVWCFLQTIQFISICAVSKNTANLTKMKGIFQISIGAFVLLFATALEDTTSNNNLQHSTNRPLPNFQPPLPPYPFQRPWPYSNPPFIPQPWPYHQPPQMPYPMPYPLPQPLPQPYPPYRPAPEPYPLPNPYPYYQPPPPFQPRPPRNPFQPYQFYDQTMQYWPNWRNY